MAGKFSDQEWTSIEDHLSREGDAAFGLPERNADTVFLGSWNIKKFGGLLGDDGNRKRSDGAWKLIERFAARCDFLALQEVQDRLESVRELRARLNVIRPDADYRLISSDLTGRAPGDTGLGERLSFIYDTKRILPGDIASDLSFDQSAVLKNVNAAINKHRSEILEKDAEEAHVAAKALAWLKSFTGFYKDNLPQFFQFIRAPHMATFKVIGGPGQVYEIACVNAHLLSGKPKEREREFFALLEWLLRRTGINGQLDAPVTILFGDLNLDFNSDNNARRDSIESYIVNLNLSQRGRKNVPKVNFPFLSTPPGRQPVRTNSRENETFDHIAWFSHDDRFPRGRHNRLAGNDGFDYGIFNFLKLFREAGPGILANGEPAFEKFVDDVSDHMPDLGATANTIRRPEKVYRQLTGSDHDKTLIVL